MKFMSIMYKVFQAELTKYVFLLQRFVDMHVLALLFVLEEFTTRVKSCTR